MKIFYHILIIFFVGLSLFIIREDVVDVINNISAYLDKDDNNSVIELKEEEMALPGEIEMPGALRVIDDLINQTNNVDLSKNNIIASTNNYRKENGNLGALKENQKLNLSAEKKLQDMFDKQYFEHISPSDIGVADLARQVGYEYILIGENLALGNFKNDLTLVDAWMASPGHRENILNKNYTEIGVAVAQGKFEGKNVWMAVQHFGTPRSFCPVVDQVLYGIINLNQDQIKEMEKNILIRKEMIDKGALYEGKSYDEQIDEYNSLIGIYNKLISETKEKVDYYNEQVQAFNNCIYKTQ